jgi:hypothetical protein
MATGQGQQQTIATVIALLVVTEIVLHFCWRILDSYFFTNFTVTAGLAILAVIALLFVLFWREELVLGLVGGGNGEGRSRKGMRVGGVRNGVKRDRRRR